MQINIVRPFLPDLSEIQTEFAECLKSGLVTNNSPHVRNFEDQLQAYYGCPVKPSLNCNGEMALHHLIQAWKHKLGYSPHESFEALVPSFTFSGTINALVANNIHPVFCDVDQSLVLDLRKLVVDSPNIKMIVAVGAYGNLADLNYLQQLAKKHNLVVILDNAPAFGSTFQGKFPWQFGFSEMISFHATKIFSSMEGGCNIVNDPEIDDLLRRIRDFGQYEKTRGDVDIPGLNSKMTEVCALVGLRNLKRVEQILSLRRATARQYNAHFRHLQSQGKLRVMEVHADVECPYLYYPIILNEDATAFVMYMQEHGIAVRRYYTANHGLKFYQGKYRQQDLTFTDEIKDQIVSLPLHTVMAPEEIEYLFETTAGYFVR